MENLVADHLSRLPLNEEALPLKDEFSDKHLFLVRQSTPWYANVVNYLVTNTLPGVLSRVMKNRVKKEPRHYVWDNPYLWKYYTDLDRLPLCP